jgi:hypothetical protein
VRLTPDPARCRSVASEPGNHRDPAARGGKDIRPGLRQPSCGAVTFVQRFGSALQLNVHFHVLVPDGAFDHDGVFVAADPPDDDDVRQLLLRAGRRVIALLRRFFGEDEPRRGEIDGLLEALDATSATPAPALFPRTERRAALSAFVEGFSLHAATRVMASDRRGLWRLCASGARGALAASRLSELPDGRFAWDMKRALPDGRARLVLTGALLLDKLAPLIPPTYANLTRLRRRQAAQHPHGVEFLPRRADCCHRRAESVPF